MIYSLSNRTILGAKEQKYSRYSNGGVRHSFLGCNYRPRSLLNGEWKTIINKNFDIAESLLGFFRLRTTRIRR